MQGKREEGLSKSGKAGLMPRGKPALPADEGCLSRYRANPFRLKYFPCFAEKGVIQNLPLRSKNASRTEKPYFPFPPGNETIP